MMQRDEIFNSRYSDGSKQENEQLFLIPCLVTTSVISAAADLTYYHSRLMSLTKSLKSCAACWRRRELGNITQSPQTLNLIPDFITPCLFPRVPGIVQESW